MQLVGEFKVWDYTSIAYLKSAVTQKLTEVHCGEYSYVGLTNHVKTRFHTSGPPHSNAKRVLYAEIVFHGNTLQETRTEQLKELENHYPGCLNDIDSGKVAQNGNFVYHLYFIVE